MPPCRTAFVEGVRADVLTPGPGRSLMIASGEHTPQSPLLSPSIFHCYFEANSRKMLELSSDDFMHPTTDFATFCHSPARMQEEIPRPKC
jgi:hypothetical protein